MILKYKSYFKNKMIIFHLISGYKGSGKDSFYNYLIGEKDYKFEIFNYSRDVPYYLDFGVFKDTKHYRIGIADQVKNLVHKELNIKFKDQTTAEMSKENLLIYDKISKTYHPLRYFYIEKGMIMRDIDPDYWCNYAYENIISPKLSSPESDSSEIHIFITDWRFENEKTFFEKYGKVITYRVFRSCANNEDYSQESEHSLDKSKVDFFILGDTSDIELAKKKFPPYFMYYYD
jgi:hypothetical protein